ncbi:probable BOI-related E3 ubiquitin-protein ligase 3 isoform X1 [Nymphaea colorata]|nr:probable BOI-related E3 ubiquitin-protein ligase 3 isoform X1 [Nymphaea colorata]
MFVATPECSNELDKGGRSQLECGWSCWRAYWEDAMTHLRNLLMDETQNQIPTPITFIGPASFTDHPQYVPSYHFMGPPVGQVHAGAEGADQQQQQLWGRNAREKELFENSQISSIDFLQHQGSVSTGLGLALDDRKLASSGDSPPMPLGFFEHEVSIELQRQEAEIDRFLKIQGERLRQAVVEKVQAQHLSILSLIEEQMLRKLQEQEAKVDELNLKNADLEERMKQLNIEAAAWQHHAKCNESMITTLKYNIQQVYAQSKECKEGCGDSEVNDAASRCDGGPEDMHILISKENKDLKEHMNCKVCRVNKVCMLLLPCRHLCLCKDCESKLSFCPLCQSSKFVGMEVYM